MPDRTTSYWSAATSIAGSGISRTVISKPGQPMRLFRFAPALRRNPAPDALIRIFQSEVSEVREDPEPAQLRITLHVLAGLFTALLAVSFFMHINRIVTS